MWDFYLLWVIFCDYYVCCLFFCWIFLCFWFFWYEDRVGVVEFGLVEVCFGDRFVFVSGVEVGGDVS